MGHSYEKSRKIATKTILVLAAITIFEVLIALLGKGYLIPGVHLSLFLIGGLMIILSAFKAYLIVYEFMHMKYEVPGLRRSVILPMLLLVWALIAFLYEGGYWRNIRVDGVRKPLVETITHKEDGHHEETHHHGTSTEEHHDGNHKKQEDHGHGEGHHEEDHHGDHHGDHHH